MIHSNNYRYSTGLYNCTLFTRDFLNMRKKATKFYTNSWNTLCSYPVETGHFYFKLWDKIFLPNIILRGFWVNFAIPGCLWLCLDCCRYFSCIPGSSTTLWSHHLLLLLILYIVMLADFGVCASMPCVRSWLISTLWSQIA